MKEKFCNLTDAATCQWAVVQAELIKDLTDILQQIELADAVVLPFLGDLREQQELDHHIITARDRLEHLIAKLRA